MQTLTIITHKSLFIKCIAQWLLQFTWCIRYQWYILSTSCHYNLFLKMMPNHGRFTLFQTFGTNHQTILCLQFKYHIKMVKESFVYSSKSGVKLRLEHGSKYDVNFVLVCFVSKFSLFVQLKGRVKERFPWHE